MDVYSARAAWHDAHHNDRRHKLAAVITQSRGYDRLSEQVSMTIAGKVQSAVARLAPVVRAFGDHLYSPMATTLDRYVAEEAVFALAFDRLYLASGTTRRRRMSSVKLARARVISKAVLFRYRAMHQGDGKQPDPLPSPEALRQFILEAYQIRLASAAWAREWDDFIAKCFEACQVIDTEALAAVATVLADMLEPVPA